MKPFLVGGFFVFLTFSSGVRGAESIWVEAEHLAGIKRGIAGRWGRRRGGGQTIRWMNVTRYLQARKDKKSRQIIFAGEKLDMEAVWKVRDGFFPPNRTAVRKG